MRCLLSFAQQLSNKIRTDKQLLQKPAVTSRDGACQFHSCRSRFGQLGKPSFYIFRTDAAVIGNYALDIQLGKLRD